VSELLGNGATDYRLDVREQSEWDRAMPLALAVHGGRLDVLVNSAGITAQYHGASVLRKNVPER
jgi:hypothetical protein